ncbi:MAG: AI-2E family transporter [Prevotellaceae bacterium]|jgi:predicted PurR-regulated permease PerM|nr:AI-2E family transporter [Prevotellaceae bacterium]
MFSRNNNQMLGQLIFTGVLISIALVIFFQLKDFTGSFLGAITLYLVLRKTLFHLINKKRWKAWKASLLLVSLSVLFLLCAGYWIFKVIAIEFQSFDYLQFIDGIKQLSAKINSLLGYQIISDTFISDSQNFLVNIASSVLNTTYNVAANLFMMIIILYFMFAKSREMEKAILEYFPFKGNSLQMIKLEIKNMIKGNAIGIPLIMLAQGVVAALGYWIFGLGGIAFWAFMTAIFGLVPIVGTTAIWLPLSIFVMVNGNLWTGVFLLVYGIVAIANIDNIIRLVLMKKMANTHPLTVILGVLLGIPLFGFWGIIFGPLLISGFLLLIKIYYSEYGLKKSGNKSNRKRRVRKPQIPPRA